MKASIHSRPQEQSVFSEWLNKAVFITFQHTANLCSIWPFNSNKSSKAKQQIPLYTHLIFIHTHIQTDRNAVPVRGNEASTMFPSSLTERVNIVIVSMVTILSTMAAKHCRIFQGKRELRKGKTFTAWFLCCINRLIC